MTPRQLALVALLFAPPLAAQRVAVEPLASGHWRATWHLDTPTTALRFERQAAWFRERAWRVVTPGFVWRRDGDAQLLAATHDSLAATTIAVEFATFAEPLPKEYEPFQAFSDGAVSLYTGHLYATPERGVTTDPAIRAVRITPPDGRHAVVRGTVVRDQVHLDDTEGSGTYVYLGTAQPVESPDLVAIVDPGLPPWLAAQLRRELPRLFAAYREAFATPLPWRPTVLYAYQRGVEPGLSAGGGTLTGLITMSLTGAGWSAETPEAREQAFALLAHEAVHLWNGQLVAADPSPAGAWIHEGSADAFADAMLLAFGIIDSARALERQQAALNRCASAVGRGSVTTAIARGQPRAVYDCGQVMALWSARALASVSPGATLATIWRSLIAAARADSGHYDQQRYFTSLARLGVDAATISAMTRFVAEPGRMSAAVTALQGLGVPVEALPFPPDGVDQAEYALGAFAHLQAVACGRTSFYNGTPIRTVAIPGCEGFATELRVHRLAGIPLAQGARVHDAVVAACARGQGVPVGDDQGTTVLTVTCNRPLAARPPWYQIRRLVAGGGAGDG